MTCDVRRSDASKMETTMTTMTIEPKQDKKMDLSVVEITPELASEWIATQVNPRNPQAAAIETYRRAYEAGRWIIDPGLYIAFDSEGRLIDGQTRLYAIIRHGNPVRMYVRWNTPADVVLASVNTRARTIADQMVMSGLADRDYASNVASVGRLIWLRLSHGQIATSGHMAKTGRVRLNGEDIAEAYARVNLDSRWIAAEAQRIYRLASKRTKLFSPGAIGYALAQRAPRVMDFLESLVADDAKRLDSQVAARRFVGNLRSRDSNMLQHYALAIAYNEPERKRMVSGAIVPDLAGGIFERIGGLNDA